LQTAFLWLWNCALYIPELSTEHLSAFFGITALLVVSVNPLFRFSLAFFQIHYSLNKYNGKSFTVQSYALFPFAAIPHLWEIADIYVVCSTIMPRYYSQ